MKNKQYAVSAVAYALVMILLLTQQRSGHGLLVDWAQLMVLIYSGLVVLDQSNREIKRSVMDTLLDLSGVPAGVLTAISLFI